MVVCRLSSAWRPSGGGVKDSGYGSEAGPEAMECYINTRSIAIRNV